MDTSVNVSGSWNSIKQGSAVNVSGTWQPIKAIFTRVSGVWQQVWIALSAHLTDQYSSSFSSLPGTAFAGYRLNSDGRAQLRDGSSYFDVSGEWLVAGLNSDFECRATVVSGSLASGVTGVWMALSTSREWTVTRSTAGVSECVLTIEIRMAASPNTVLATATITIDAEASS